MRLAEDNFRNRIKYYAPAWLFPFIMILASVNEQLNGNQDHLLIRFLISWSFIVLNLPVMYGWLTGKIPAKELIVFWWLTPFILWVGLVFLKLAIVG